MEKKVQELFETTELTLEQIADTVGTTRKIVFRLVKATYSKEERLRRKSENYRRSKLGKSNPMFGKHGAAHHNYKGVVADGYGYLMVLKPEWYTGRKGSKHVFLHSVVVCEALGITEVPAGFAVHHLDHNPLNNDLDNLALMTPSAHSRLHHRERATTRGNS